MQEEPKDEKSKVESLPEPPQTTEVEEPKATESNVSEINIWIFAKTGTWWTDKSHRKYK